MIFETNKNKYDYVICGGGISGITLAYVLSKNNYKVALIERDDALGGTWKNIWIDNTYFSEHSPQVLTVDYNSSFYRLLNTINYDYNKDIEYLYGGFLNTSLMFMKFFIKNFSFLDTMKLSWIYVTGSLNKNETVYEWYNRVEISKSGKQALDIISIAIATTSKKLLLKSFLTIHNNIPVSFIKFKNTNWINKLENTLLQNNVDIYKNHELITYNLDTTQTKVISVIAINKLNNKFIEFQGNYHVLSVPPKAFLKILKNEYNKYNKNSIKIKNNWMEYDKIQKLLTYSSYGAIGFQFHFDKIQDNNIFDNWLDSARNDYGVIILKPSDYLKSFSNDPNIKEVWSCSIIDTDKIVKKFNKSINELTLNEIVTDIIDIYKIVPYKITFYPNINKSNGIWTSNDSSFAFTKYGIIKNKGHLDNLYAVTPYTCLNSEMKLVTINVACDNAIKWLNTQNIPTFNLERNYLYDLPLLYKLIIILILLILVGIIYFLFLN